MRSRVHHAAVGSKRLQFSWSEGGWLVRPVQLNMSLFMLAPISIVAGALGRERKPDDR
jgi:hypothetical protein